MVTFTGDGSVVMVHRLVARVIREQLAVAGELAAVCQATADLLKARAESLHEGWHTDRGAARDLAEHITALADSAAACPGDDQLARDVLRLRGEAVWLLLSLGDSTALSITLSQALATDYERTLGPDHPDTLAGRSNLARAYRIAGRTAEAIALHERKWQACSGRTWRRSAPMPTCGPASGGSRRSRVLSLRCPRSTSA